MFGFSGSWGGEGEILRARTAFFVRVSPKKLEALPQPKGPTNLHVSPILSATPYNRVSWDTALFGIGMLCPYLGCIGQYLALFQL